MSIGTIALLIAGLVGLVAGAEALVRGAARLAARTGMSSVVIGLTVVAFGTSAPELAVSVGDALRGGPEAGSIAIGNVVGSNIANILLVLGAASAVGGALFVAQRIVRLDVPIMIGASVLLLVFVLNEKLGRIEGVVPGNAVPGVEVREHRAHPEPRSAVGTHSARSAHPLKHRAGDGRQHQPKKQNGVGGLNRQHHRRQHSQEHQAGPSRND